MRDESVTLQIRLFRLICATTCGLCLLVVLPMNLFQNLPKWINLADVGLGLAGGYCYWESLRGRNFFFGFFATILLLLNPVWFLNAGSEGSLTYYFPAVLLYPLVIFRGAARRILTTVVVLNVCGLLVFEYFVPSLTVPFMSPEDRVIDLTTGIFCSSLAIVAVTRLLLAAYDREQQRLTDYAGRLAAGELTYRAIFNATSDGLVIHDVGGRVIDVNERVCAMFRCDRTAALRLSVADMSLGTSPYSQIEATAKFELTMSQGPQVFVWRSKRCDGELFWSEVAMRVDDIAGEKRVIASIRDISLRVQAEEALRTHEERLRLALDASNQGWFDINIQTGEGRASAEYARIIGREPVDFKVTVRNWMDGVHVDDREAAENAFQKCVATGDSQTLEYRRKMQSGEWKWIRSVGKIVEFDGGGKALRMLGTHTDITERKALESRLQHSQRLESVATLAGGVAHDLNNILTPMLMAGSVLLHKLAETRDREMVMALESGARRGAAIVRQLMMFSQSVAHSRVAVSPAELIREVAQQARTTFPTNIVVVERIATDLWSIMADPAQLRQVMNNLCVNAREAMPQGGTLTLTVENTRLTQRPSTANPWGKGGAFLVMSVSDTGRGIPTAIIGRIFDPFFTTKQVGEGSGLGLSTAHGIVNGHGGTITVESQPGQGATFNVFLPASIVGAVEARSSRAT
jgi:PAS domain S-box-containing protein